MPEAEADRRAHLVLHNTSEAFPFTAHSPGGGPKTLPARDRQTHGQALAAQIHALQQVATEVAAAQQEHHLESGIGLQIEFVGQPDAELAFQSLGNDPKRIELLSVRREGEITHANVFVPDGRLSHFERYITEYLQDRKGKKGQSLDHKSLINTISAIRAAGIRALWTDDPELLPADVAASFWWEVWLPVRGARQAVVADFRRLATLGGCVVREEQVNFPERTVMLMFGSQEQLAQSVMILNCVAELRRAKDTAEFFDSMDIEEQAQWMNDLIARTNVVNTDDQPYVCLLDSGVNRGHPMLQAVVASQDVHAVNPAWGTHDDANHGTGLAGLIAYGELTEHLAGNAPLSIAHKLESVKLVPDQGGNAGDAQHHAYLFAEAVSRPQVVAPLRRRLFTSAFSASDYRDRGRPSSWSAMVDRLAADVDSAGEDTRLFVLAAGNTVAQQAWNTYPDSLSSNLIHDPGQAWNAITVGAYTQKIDTEIATLNAIAAQGGLSPLTTTSRTWDSAWPLKPDVVLEGGNIGKDAMGAVGCPALNLLTINNEPN
jgi:hypothetical protein